jgi:hypothetical protein
MRYNCKSRVRRKQEFRKMHRYCIENFLLECTIRKVKENNELLVQNGTHLFLVYVDVTLSGVNISRKTQRLCLVLLRKKTKYMFTSRYQNTGRHHIIKMTVKSFANLPTKLSAGGNFEIIPFSFRANVVADPYILVQDQVLYQ